MYLTNRLRAALQGTEYAKRGTGSNAFGLNKNQRGGAKL